MKKDFIAGVIVGSLLFGTAGVFAVQYVATENPFSVQLNGNNIPIKGYNIDGSTYFKLRDIADIIGSFEVGFDNNTIQLAKDGYSYSSDKGSSFDLSNYIDAPQTKPEDEVKTTVSSYMSAVLKFDLDEASKFAVDDVSLNQLTDKVCVSKITESMRDTSGSFIPQDSVADYISILAKRLLSTITYEVKDVKINGNNADAAVMITYPDFEAIGNSNSNVDPMDLMKEAFGFDLTDSATFMQKYAEKKQMSAADLIAKFANGDQEALAKDVFETFKAEFTTAFEKMGDKLIELTQNKSISSDVTVKLEKDKNNAWKITDMN